MASKNKGKRKKKQAEKCDYEAFQAENVESKQIYEMLCLVEGNIADKQMLQAEKIDTIVNAANPTLMGSNQGVDGAIHKAIYELSGKKYLFREKIYEDLHFSGEKNAVHCERGRAVITSGYGLCKHVIHVVGAKYDGSPEKKENCSSSRVQILESCYSGIVELLKQNLDIRRIAIPIIGAGDYKFPYELAVRIAIAGISNALVEWKEHDPELFGMAKIEKIYFFIYHHSNKKRKEYMTCAEAVRMEYRVAIMQEQRIVFQKSTQAHFRYIREIQRYDEIKGYFSVVKNIRLLLMWLRVLFLPAMWVKDVFGGNDWKKRRRFVELLALAKVVLPVVYYFIFEGFAGSKYEHGLAVGFSALAIYAMCDTMTYLLTLIVMADIQRPSANIIRSILMLFVNYMEVSLDMTWLYWITYRDRLSIWDALLYGVLGESRIETFAAAVDYIWPYMNAGIRFFFISLVFGYLANHMRQRKFRS